MSSVYTQRKIKTLPEPRAPTAITPAAIATDEPKLTYAP